MSIYLGSNKVSGSTVIGGVNPDVGTGGGNTGSTPEVVVPASMVLVDATSGSKAPVISVDKSNTEYRYLYASGITSLTLNTSDVYSNDTEAYYGIVFLSGTTATTIVNTLNAYFKGDDCLNGVFTPMATKTYEIGLWWNGLNWNAVVRGS